MLRSHRFRVSEVIRDRLARAPSNIAEGLQVIPASLRTTCPGPEAINAPPATQVDLRKKQRTIMSLSAGPEAIEAPPATQVELRKKTKHH